MPIGIGELRSAIDDFGHAGTHVIAIRRLARFQNLDDVLDRKSVV